MNRESLNWWLTLLANLGVLGGLVFVGFEIRQNTAQLRAEGARSITEMVNAMNAGVYLDPTLAELVLRGERDLDAQDLTVLAERKARRELLGPLPALDGALRCASRALRLARGLRGVLRS